MRHSPELVPATPAALVVLALSAALAFRSTAGRAPAALPPKARVCVAWSGSAWAAHACDAAAGDGYFLDDDGRAAWDRPLCWWTADERAFETVSGVGPALSARLVLFRDTGGVPTRIEDIRGVGPRLGSSLRGATTLDCPRVRAPGVIGDRAGARFVPPI